MNYLYIAPSKSTPAVEFSAETHTLSITGESYPENAAGFYKPVFEWMNSFFHSKDTGELHLIISLVYFNSSSSKALMNLFDRLDAAAHNGWQISVAWEYHAENDIIQESGEEFREDYESLDFSLHELQDSVP